MFSTDCDEVYNQLEGIAKNVTSLCKFNQIKNNSVFLEILTF